ncbi:MAG: ATP-binding protein [Chloroflexi bacterium]|nr:ATP-binding protein [Chloroflexota bacterium]
MLALVPLEPLFVDRVSELAEFDALLEALALGRRRHVALLGLRRIGKTLLLDEVRRRHPRSAIAYLPLDEVVSSPEDFARSFAIETLRQVARTADGRITPDIVDIAFYQEIVGRVANIGQNCRYLMETALRTDAEGMRNTLEAVLRQVARWQPITRASIERRLRRHHAHTQIHKAINLLIDTDFLREAAGVLEMPDPVFALWLVVEPERRDPEAMSRSARAIQRLIAWYEAQHGQDRQEMGTLFERRVENVARQFNGHTVEGKLFGIDGEVRLPVVRSAGRVRVDDASGHYGEGPDSYEVDIVTTGDRPSDFWAIEAKHRQGAITRAMVERFLKNARAASVAHNLSFARLWIVAPRGIRPDAMELARGEGILTSGLRQLEQLERQLADSFTTSLRLVGEGRDPVTGSETHQQPGE